jgi:hypothetical protein
MKKQAIRFFIFSFICFIGVLVFGSILGPIKRSFSDTEVFRNISLFHSHFDQLCWLGSAALGCTFWGLDHKFKGSEIVLKIFAFSYMLGSLLFSSGFLFRALGVIYNSSVIEKVATIGMISFGGFFIVVTIVCAVYVAICILSFTRRKRIQNVVTG